MENQAKADRNETRGEVLRRRLTCPRCAGFDVWSHRGKLGFFAEIMAMLGFTLFVCRKCQKRFYVIKD